ncbi:MAG: VWA domain-containing protein [Bdellovibrio sp.]|nr:VWA domain-containing protein [Bdellovibrio sp.]
MKATNLSTKLVLICVFGLSAACAKLNFAPLSVEDQSAIVPVPAPSKTINSTEVVAYGNKQVDFLLVLDDSNSMYPELAKLAARMSTFVSSLDASNIDWQMCLTTTRSYSSADGPIFGTPLNWRNYAPASGTPGYLLKRGTANLNTIFTTTVENLTIGGLGSADERAIKTTHDNFKSYAMGTHNCYRPGAAISVIVISDEDERSVGGDPQYVKPADASGAYIAFDSEDHPAAMIAQAKTSFGDDVRLTFNSIIVKPGDNICEAEQDKDASPSHPGRVYAEASRLTDGGIGSICETDYSASLNTFKDKIVNSLSALNLQCEPEPKTLKVKVEGLEIGGLKLDGKALKFSFPLIEGTQIDLQYDCKE